MARLDPWQDADTIAARLQAPAASLTLVLGAETWCRKCERLRPLFEVVAAAERANPGVWLWLDLEDHAEFIGSYVPDDLPLLLRWEQGRCVQAGVLMDVDPAAAEPLLLRPQAVPRGLPDLWAGFALGQWQTG